MIIKKDTPYTMVEIGKLRKAYDVYIKTVIDINRKICSAGAKMHIDSEQILLKDGSNQADLWGGGIDLETKIVDFNSFINIRPADGNNSNELLDPVKRSEFERLTKYFFRGIYGK
jgi:hypothetical protein